MSRESVSRDRSSHYSYTSDGPITVSYFGIRPESTNQLDFLYSVPILIRSRMIFDKLGCYCSKVHTCTLSLSNPRPQYRRSRVRIWRRSQNTKVSSDNTYIQILCKSKSKCYPSYRLDGVNRYIAPAARTSHPTSL